MTVRDIVKQYLLDNGFDGLCDPDGTCSCKIADLAPCCSSFDCEPGYKVPCTCDGGCGFHIAAEKPKTKGVK